MGRKTVGVAFMVLVAGQAIAAVDYTCLNRCTAQNYQYNYCVEVCSYGQPAAPVYRPNPALTEAITRGVPAPDLTGVLMQAESIRMQREQIRMQQEQAEAQRRLIDEQARAQQIENDRRAQEMRQRSSAAEAAQHSPQDLAIFEKWKQVADPRMGLYPDFAAVVFAPDVACTVQMIELMASSPYAADIAYYLGKNKARSLEIAQMPLLQQAAAIREIESTVAGQ